MEETSNRREKIAALVLFVFSLIYLYGCMRLRIGRVHNPGPGFLPLVVGILLICFTGLNLWRALRKGATTGDIAQTAPPVGSNILIPLGTAAFVLAYPFLLSGLKYILSTFLVMFFMLAINKYKGIGFNALIALVIAIASFVFFCMILGVVLPMGKLETLILQIR